MWAPGRATRGAGGQPAGDEAESPSHVLWREEAARRRELHATQHQSLYKSQSFPG